MVLWTLYFPACFSKSNFLFHWVSPNSTSTIIPSSLHISSMPCSTPGPLISKSFIFSFFSQLVTMNQRWMSNVFLLKSVQSVVSLCLFLSWIEINGVSLCSVSLHEASCLLNLIAQPCWNNVGLLSKKGPFEEDDLISQSVFGVIWKVILHYFQSVLALGLTRKRKLSCSLL